MDRRGPPSRLRLVLLLAAIAGCPADIQGIAAHTCALLDDGSAWCWGDNRHGQLGDGSAYDRALPVAVAGLPPARAIAAGFGFTCAASTDGRAFCWGRDDQGQLGDGGGPDRRTPAELPGLAGVRTLAAGWASACAALDGGEVLCWGELGGVGGAPAAVTGLPAAALEVAVGTGSACAILSNGEGWCWGGDRIAVAAFTTVVSVAATWGGPCAALEDGSVTCEPGLPGPAVAVSGAAMQRCALLADGTVWCWGEAPFGGSSATSGPAQLATGAKAVAVGDGAACAILQDGGLACWGENWSGQLGDGTDRERGAPVAVRGLPRPAVAVTASLGDLVFGSGCGGSATPGE